MKSDAIAYPPRGMRREDAARYVGISPTLFDEWVKARQMPRPAKIGGVVLWDRFALDAAFTALTEPVNSIDGRVDAARHAR